MDLVAPAERRLVAFGPFRFDQTSRLLSREGVEVPLPPRVLGVLALLVARPGELVTKQELMSAVWRDAFVTETSLSEAISVLRQTLGDDPQKPTYIQTLHRRGYRFIAPVQVVLPPDGPSHTALPPRGESHGDRPREGGSHSVADSGGFRLQAQDPAKAERPSAQRPAPAHADAEYAAAEPYPRLSLVVSWTITLFALILAASAVWAYLRTTAPPSRSAARFRIALPEGVALSRSGAPIAVSPDGSIVAVAGCGGLPAEAGSDSSEAGSDRTEAGRHTGDECGIYLRPLSQADATRVAGTEGGASPFFSPDGRWLGYFADRELRKIAIAGGSPIALAPAATPFGATWTRDGRIVFAASADGGLSIVPANGGPVQPLTTPASGEGGHRWPDALADGSAVVFTVAAHARQADRHYAGVVSLRTGAWSRLLDGVSAARASMPGYLVAQRGADLVAAAFDPRALSVSGLAVAVASNPAASAASPQFAASTAGTLVTGGAGRGVLDIVINWDADLRRLVPPAQPSVLR